MVFFRCSIIFVLPLCYKWRDRSLPESRGGLSLKIEPIPSHFLECKKTLMITASSLLVKLIDQSIASVVWDLTFLFHFFFFQKSCWIIIIIEQFRWLVVRRGKEGGRGVILTRISSTINFKPKWEILILQETSSYSYHLSYNYCHEYRDEVVWDKATNCLN